MKATIFFILLIAGLQLNAQTSPTTRDSLTQKQDQWKTKQPGTIDSTRYPKPYNQPTDVIRRDSTRIPKNK